MKSTWETRKPYNGVTRSLAIALDVGTTFSGVSYAILEPAEVPKIHGVTRFPGQEHVAGNSKIPTIMYYDKHGSMVAAGAEAEGGSMAAQAEDEGWTKAELFKLRLRPKSMKLEMNGMRLGHLPRGKTAVDLFGDFLGYLFRCTRIFIIDTHANGPSLWKAVERDIQFVLSHPNGWEGSQQSKMRRAAIRAGLIPDTDEGKARVRFVTEGEASLHACVLNGLAADVLSNPSGHGFLVADAGGGTLDISSYAMRGVSPLVIEEVAPPDCIFAGSVFVSRRARAFFEEKLKNSRYGTPDSLDHIAKRFDETTKRLFRNTKETQFVHFGSPLDKDAAVGIRAGQLKLTGGEVADLFEPSIQAAVDSILSQIESSKGVVKSVWLVGGFAASPWLFNQLQERLEPLHVTVSRPDSQTSKAVADGAIGFYCDHHVSARMSKHSYGVEFLREFDAGDEEHIARQHRLFELPSGPKLLPDAFDCILLRGIKIKESTTFSRKYCTELTSLSTLSVFEVEIWCYRGTEESPKWILRNREEFSTLCFVRADLSPLSGSAQAKTGTGGKTYWTIVFSIEIHFGLTEFKARIKWNDNGKVRYGPASIVYNENGTREEDQEPENLTEDLNSVSSQHSRSPSRVPSAAGTPRNISPSRGAEALTPTNGIPRSARPPSPTHPPPPIIEERKKSSTSRAISIHGSASASRHASPPSAPPQAHLSPKVASAVIINRSIPSITPIDPALTPVEAVHNGGSTPTKHASSSRNTPTHSRSTSFPRAATSTSNVAFPTAPTPPVVGSRKTSPSRNVHVAAEPPVPATVVGSRKVSFSSRADQTYPAPAATAPAVEPPKTSPPSRSGLATPTIVKTTAQSPFPSVSPAAAASPPPVLNVEPSGRKSRKSSVASGAPSLIPSPSIPAEKGKSKATSGSDSTGLTYATSTPLVRSTKSSLSRSEQSPIGETLNGIWGQSRSATASATASPWKGGRPLDPPPATIAEIRKELSNVTSSPPIVGDSQRPLETILEPPTDNSVSSKLEAVGIVHDNKHEVQSRDPQEPSLPVQMERPRSIVVLPPQDAIPEPNSNVPRDVPLDNDWPSKIPGGFNDLLGETIQPEQPSSKTPIITDSGKKSTKKKKTDSKTISSVPTPVETTPSTPWPSQNVDSKDVSPTAQAASVSPALNEQLQPAIDQNVESDVIKRLEERMEDVVNQVLISGQKETTEEEKMAAGDGLINEIITAASELLGGTWNPTSSHEPIITEPAIESDHVKTTAPPTPGKSVKSGAASPNAWRAGATMEADRSPAGAAGESTLVSMGVDWIGSTANALGTAFGVSGSNDNDLGLDPLSLSSGDVVKDLPAETPVDTPVEQHPASGVDSFGQVEEQRQAGESQQTEDNANVPELEKAEEEAVQGTVDADETMEGKTQDSKRASQVDMSPEAVATEEGEDNGDAEPETQEEQNATDEVENEQEAAQKTTEDTKADEWNDGLWGDDANKKKKGKKGKATKMSLGDYTATGDEEKTGVEETENATEGSGFKSASKAKKKKGKR